MSSPGGRSPAEIHSTPVDGVEIVGALSPSRASDFMACPLLYRFRTIDKLPEPPSPDAVRGTLIHSILEDLFDLPAPERTEDQARTMLLPAWERLVDSDPGMSDMFGADAPGADAPGADALGADAASLTAWLTTCRAVLDRYFTLEDPTRLEPAEREVYVEAVLESKLLLRGFVDRIDLAPGGLMRVVDYKTGRAPGPMFEAKALFQMKFYALILWRVRGIVPTMLQLIYLGSGEMLRYTPDEADLLATERKVDAIFRAIRQAEQTGDWRPNPSRLCSWCSHQALCPAYGGTPPPLPALLPPESATTTP